MNRVIALGEGMIELSRKPDGAAQIGTGGDVLNTAVYLARLGVASGLFTAVGNDPWSDGLIDAWISEGVDCRLVLRHPDRLPGVYGISLNDAGERSFSYWRAHSAARTMFECPGADDASRDASAADILLVSGISLAVLEGDGRKRALEVARSVRAKGGRVAFDPNYRPRLWSDVSAYRDAILEFASEVDIALPSFEDEAAVWGDQDTAQCYRRWRDLGVADVVVKDGANGALTVDGFVPATKVEHVADTTGAGDSFNAGYLAGRLGGGAPVDAAALAARVAGCVVQHSGAIIPRAVMARAIPEVSL
jgi:2-dehydro-3-deoxygluconokinase